VLGSSAFFRIKLASTVIPPSGQKGSQLTL
jgi:hypothetical protein